MTNKRIKYSKQDVIDMIDQVGSEFPDVDPAIIKSVIQIESNFNVYAKNKEKVGNTAAGLGQHTIASQKDHGITDPYDPIQNIRGTYKYIKNNLKRYNGDAEKAVLAYNQGPGNVKKNEPINKNLNKKYMNDFDRNMKTFGGMGSTLESNKSSYKDNIDSQKQSFGVSSDVSDDTMVASSRRRNNSVDTSKQQEMLQQMIDEYDEKIRDFEQNKAQNKFGMSNSNPSAFYDEQTNNNIQEKNNLEVKGFEDYNNLNNNNFEQNNLSNNEKRYNKDDYLAEVLGGDYANKVKLRDETNALELSQNQNVNNEINQVNNNDLNNNINKNNDVNNDRYNKDAYLKSILGDDNIITSKTDKVINPASSLSTEDELYEKGIDKHTLSIETGIEKSVWNKERENKGYKIKQLVEAFLRLDDPMGYLQNASEKEFQDLTKMLKIYGKMYPEQLKELKEMYGAEEAFGSGFFQQLGKFVFGVGETVGGALESAGSEFGADLRAYNQQAETGFSRAAELRSDITNHNFAHGVGEVGGVLTAYSALPMAATSAGSGLLLNAGKVGLSVGAQDLLTSTSREKELDNFWKDKAKQATTATAVGTALPLGLAGGGKVVSKVGEKLGIHRKAEPNNAFVNSADNIKADMKAQGYKYDNTQNDALIKAQGGERWANEMKEVARTNERFNEHVAENIATARKNLDTFRSGVNDSSVSSANSVANKVEKQLNNVNTVDGANVYAKTATRISDDLANTRPDNYAEMFRVNNESDLLSHKIEASRLYKQAFDLSDQAKNYNVSETEKFINEAVHRINNDKVVSNADVDIVRNAERIFRNGYDNFKLKDMERSLQIIKEESRDLLTKNNGKTNSEVNNLNRLAEAMQKDMDNAIDSAIVSSKSKEFSSKIKEARNYYRDNVVPREKTYKNMFVGLDKNGNAISGSNMLKQMTETKDIEEARRAIKYLSDESREYLKSSVLNDIFAKSRIDGNPNASLSLKKVGTNIDKYTNKKTGQNLLRDVLFTKQELQNFNNLTRGVERIARMAGDSELVLKTGARISDKFKGNANSIIGVLGGAGALSAGMSALPSLVVGGILAGGGKLINNKVISNILDPKMSHTFLKFGRSSPASKDYADAYKDIIKVVSHEEKERRTKK